MKSRPIGVFDSGMGGLTILRSFLTRLPQYDYLYLGDNARVPYGNRSFETVLEYTWQSVKYLLDSGCPLVILACNTASAKALRNIQQQLLPKYYPERRVLGVIRPTTEVVGNYTTKNKIGVFATEGTVQSESYKIEINRFFPEVEVFQQACPMWVPLIENLEHTQEGADYFVEKYVRCLLNQCDEIDAIILACTHYPLLSDQIKTFLPESTQLISQGELVAQSLENYLERHQEIDQCISRNGNSKFLTTDSAEEFESKASYYFGENIKAESIHL